MLNRIFLMEKEQQARRSKIRYADTSSIFSSQFLVNSTHEDITVGFSSGYMNDPGSGETSLRVHSRISMTQACAKRLHELLGKALAGNGEIQEPSFIKSESDEKKNINDLK